MDDMEERLSRQIHQQHELKNAAYLSSQRDIIRAEERIKFERNYLEQASSSDEKCRLLRDELAAKVWNLSFFLIAQFYPGAAITRWSAREIRRDGSD